MTPIKVFTTFSGYDSQCLAFKYADMPFELIGWSEIEKNAIIAHNALFPEYKDRNYGDVSKIEWDKVPDFDFLTYSSPCQDISTCGWQKGLNKDDNTRSSLLWCIEEAIKIKHPKYLLMENVKALISKRFIHDFNRWLDILGSYGYKSYYKVLNSEDFGIPQHRDRIFVISIRNDLNQQFEFPQGIKLTTKLSDILENVDDEWLTYTKTTIVNDNPLTIEFKGKLFTDYDTTYTTATPRFMLPGLHNISRTLKALCHDVAVCINGKFRYLTTREYLYLMGVRKDDTDKIIRCGISEPKVKQIAGNSIVVNCLMYIYENLFGNKPVLHTSELF